MKRLWWRDKSKVWQFGPEKLHPLIRVNVACDLPPQQRSVLKGISDGKTIKEIALEMGLAEKTIEFHFKKLRQRLQMWSVALLTKFALHLGLTEPYDPNPGKEQLR